jgi:hypothetical protein
MNDIEPVMPVSERVFTRTSTLTTTWRYLGERTAADLAYCVRFGVPEAPEPTESFAGVLSYALPAGM